MHQEVYKWIFFKTGLLVGILKQNKAALSEKSFFSIFIMPLLIQKSLNFLEVIKKHQKGILVLLFFRPSAPLLTLSKLGIFIVSVKFS